MDNQTIAVVPGQNSDSMLKPAERVGLFRRSATDGDGREKRFVFVRRMNSAALALFADLLINSMLLFWLMTLAVGFVGIYSLYEMLMGFLTGGDIPFGAEESFDLVFTVVMALSMLGGHMIPAYMHSVRNGFSIMSTMKRGSRLGWTLPAAAVVALGCTYAWVFIYGICGSLMPESFFADTEIFAGSYYGMSVPAMIASGITTGVIVPIAEEFLFRGALLKSFSRYGVPFAVTATAFLFGIMHGNMFQTPFATVAGFVLAYVAVRSGSIWPGIMIHMTVNLYSVINSVLLAVLPSEYADMVHYAFGGLSGLFVLGAVIILCTCARRISWTPIDRASNNILLPEVNTKVRCKLLRFILSFGILIFVAVFIFAILYQCGIDFGVEEFMNEYFGEYYTEAVSAFSD